MTVASIIAAIVVIVSAFLYNRNRRERNRLEEELRLVKHKAQYNAQRAKTEKQKERAASELERYEALRAKYFNLYGKFPEG
jgi:lipopolysaccharide export system protein LptC